MCVWALVCLVSLCLQGDLRNQKKQKIKKKTKKFSETLGLEKPTKIKKKQKPIFQKPWAWGGSPRVSEKTFWFFWFFAFCFSRPMVSENIFLFFGFLSQTGLKHVRNLCVQSPDTWGICTNTAQKQKRKESRGGSWSSESAQIVPRNRNVKNPGGGPGPQNERFA